MGSIYNRFTLLNSSNDNSSYLDNGSSLSPWEWNRVLLQGRWPLILATSIIFILGLMGNLMVILVYKFSMPQQEARFYIPFLAMADLVAITVTSSLLVVSDTFEGVFPSDILCKILQFMNRCCVQTSLALLGTIAAHRYRLICQPTAQRLNFRKKKLLICGLFVVSCLTSVPLFVFSGSVLVRVQFMTGDASGHFCSFNTRKYPTGERVYEGVLFSLNTLMMLATVGFYIPVGRTVFAKAKSTTSAQQRDIAIEKDTTSVSNPYDGHKIPSSDLSNTNSTVNSTIDEISSSVQKEKRKGRRFQKARNSRKFTMTLIMVVIAYIISYISFYVIVWVRLNDLNAWFNSPPHRVNGYLFVYRSFMLNNMVNPIIYSIFDSAFRRNLSKLWRRVTCKNIACY